MVSSWQERAQRVIATSTWHPEIVAARHEGSRFWDTEGREYLDFASGPGAANIGWNHPDLTRQVADFILASHAGHGGNELLNPWEIELAEKIAGMLPGGKDNWKVFFSNSGGEAIEAGVILSLLRRPERRAILSFVGDFHGRMGFGRAATTSKPEHFLRLPQGPERVHYLIFPGDNPEAAPDARFLPYESYEYMAYVENQIGRFVDDIDLAVFEVVQGEGGINVANGGCLAALVSYLKAHNVRIMIDEVQTGFARTGRFFAFEHYGIVPDIVAMAKAASGGIVPIGITAFRKELDFQKPREHSNTHGGNPLACFTCLKVIEIIERENLVERAIKMGATLGAKFMWAMSFDQRWRKVMEEVRIIPGGIGLMRRVTILTPYGKPWPEMRDRIIKRCLDNGLWLMGAGNSTIRFMPPLTITELELDEGIEKFMIAVSQAIA